jgi:SecD/SecF fusion protein
MRILHKIFLSTLILLVIVSGCTDTGTHQLQLSLEPQNQTNSERLVDASRIIMNRLTRYGIPEERIKIDIQDKRLTLTINGIDTGKVAIIRELVTTVGKFGFWETFENEDAIKFLLEANAKLKEMKLQVVSADTSVGSTFSYLDELSFGVQRIDSSSLAERDKFRKENPLFSILMPRVDNEGKPLPTCLVGLAHWKDTAKVMKIMNLEEVNALFPGNMFFMWSKMPYKYDESHSLYELHSIKQTTFDNLPTFSGEEILSATVVADRSRIEPLLRLSMTPEGASVWRRLTAENINRCLAIVVDGKVLSYPRVQDEITGGNTEISGDFTLPEAQTLAAILNSGGDPLPVRMKIISQHVTILK